MAIYAVTVSVIGTAIIEVDAKNKEDAQARVEEMDMDDILKLTSFDDGVEIVDVEKS
jgi:hypothetical protein